MMQKSKAKRSFRGPVHPFLYALVWAGGAAVMVWLSYALVSPAVYSFAGQLKLSDDQIYFAKFLAGTLMVWAIPVLVTERLLKRSMRNWMVYTLVGSMLLMLWGALFPIPMTSNKPLIAFLSSLSWLWVPVVQTVWLWRRVKKAWLWPIAHLVAHQITGLFSAVIPLRLIPLASPLTILTSLPMYLILASVMYYLWTQPREAAKAKIDSAAAEADQSEAGRLQRLQDAEEHKSPWDYGENQTLRNEA